MTPISRITPLKKEKPAAILIDDDFLIRLTWKISAQSKGFSFIAFENCQDFIDQRDRFDLQIPIYIDSNLGKGVRGEEIAQDIYKLGFHEIYLTTGYEAEDFVSLPWIKAIVGKTPPW